MAKPLFDHADFYPRQNRVLAASGVPAAVGVALDCWAEWMNHGQVGRGYPSKSAWSQSGHITCWDDFEDSAANYAAHSVDGAMSGLHHNQQTALGIIWLGHSIYFRRLDVEQLGIDALKAILPGLQIRGVA